MGWIPRWDAKVDLHPVCIRRDGDEVFVAGDQGGPGLVALDDARGGRGLDAATVPAGVYRFSPFALTADRVLVPIPTHGVVAFDRQGGLAEAWSRPLHPGSCYLGVSGSQAYLVNWTSRSGPDAGGVAIADATAGTPGADARIGDAGVVPAFAPGRVCVGSADGFVWCADQGTLAHPWRQAATGRISQQGTAAVDGERFYLNNDTQSEGANAATFALEIASGDVAWKTPLGSNAQANVLLHDRVVYTATERDVFALRASDGRPIWQTSLRGNDAGTTWGSWLQVHRDRLYLHTSRALRVFSTTNGAEQPRLGWWRWNVGAFHIVGDDLYVGLVARGRCAIFGHRVKAFRWAAA